MEQPSLALEVPFVDREKELGALKSLLEQTLGGRGSTVFVVGEAGIGKTRLVREFRRYAESKGFHFSAGSSYEEEGIVPYSPWIDVIRSTLKKMPASVFQTTPPWVVTEVSRLVPDILAEVKETGLRAWLQGPSPMSAITPSTDQERIRLFQAITEFLINAAKDRGVVIFLDDISWADHASLQLFHYVARRVHDQKLILVGAYRDVELPEEHPLARITLDLSRQRIAHQIPLTRFTHEYVSQLLSSHLGGEISQEFSRLIYSRTGGNPFFVEEIVRSLVDERLLLMSNQGWSVKDVQEVQIPTSIRAVIKQRISRLGEECAQFLSIASVLGMEFDFDVLKKVASLSEESSINLLEAALRAQLVRERKRGEKVVYVFADETIREFLAGQLSLLRTRKHHLAIGNAIEELYRDEVEDHLGELAYHFVQGYEVSKAKEYSIKAGERSAGLYAHSEAMKHYMNALELLSEDESQTRLELLTKLGQTAWSRADHKELLRFCGEAIEIAERLGLKTRLGELYGLVGTSYWFLGNSKKDALDGFLQGLKVLEHMEDTLQEAVLCQQIARVYVLTGESTLASNWIKRAIEIASKLGAHEVLAHAYQTLALSLSLKEKELMISYLEDSLKLALEHSLADPACRAYNNLAGTVCEVKGHYRRAIEIWLKGIDYAKKVGYLNYEVWLQKELVFYGFLRIGEWEKCEKIAQETIRIGRELGELYLIEPYNALTFIAIARGDLPRAREFLNESLPLAVKSEWPQFLVPAYLLEAELDLALNELDKAEENLLKAFEYRTKAEGSVATFFLDVGFALVTFNVKKGRLDEASAYYQELQQMASELDENCGWAFERWARGLIAESQGNLAESIKWLQECVRLWGAVERPYDLGKARLDLSRVMEKAGNKVEAQQNFEDAQRIFDRLGIATNPVAFK